jgi:hypothetical protein
MKKISKNLVCEGAVTATTGNKTQETLMEMKKMMDAYLGATSGNETDGTCTCRMCGKHYENNAYPVVVDERCCDDCNMLVVEMYWWLHWNHDLLKDRVDNILRNRLTTDFICICLTSVAFTIYKDKLTKKLDVVVVCDDERIEKFVEVALQNWITDNCSDMNLEGVMVSPKVGVRAVTNDMKIEFELEVKEGKTDCYEESVVATKANEISERFEKVFENTDFRVDFVNDPSTEVSTITISRKYDNSNESIMIDIDDSFINITGYDNDECCCEEGVRWNHENDDIDVVYEDIKNAVGTVYAGITEYRMNEMFNN